MIWGGVIGAFFKKENVIFFESTSKEWLLLTCTIDKFQLYELFALG